MMNSKTTRKWAQIFGVAGLLLAADTSQAYVDVRVSIKFILDVNGNRPAFGNLNTDAEINSELDWANAILSGVISEFRISEIQFIELSGVSQWYNSSATNTNRDNLRNAAQADPATYHWRNDAINIYINAGSGSAISDFPPNNNMILMNQSCGNTPSCILHELGHSFNLLHTHEPCCTNQDYCADTLQDDSSWTSKDQAAQANFGLNFNQLNAAQQDQINLMWNNVMSYHVNEPQLRFSACQMSRTSSTNDSDRTWMLSKWPVYVMDVFSFFPNGRWGSPYRTVEAAAASGTLNGRVMVLQQDSYQPPATVFIGTGSPGDNVEMVTRSGTSTIEAVQLHDLPVDLSKSSTPEVAQYVREMQTEDTAARKLMHEAEDAAKGVVTEEARAAILREAEAKAKVHRIRSIALLQQAERFAAGKELLAIQFELAQRFRDSGNCREASHYFDLVANNTTQERLKARAEYESRNCGLIYPKHLRNKQQSVGDSGD
ncbi:M43 family zinc metalloprotease [Thiolapillus sp.]